MNRSLTTMSDLVTPAGAVCVRLATLDEIISLRHAVLRDGLPIEAAYFAEDRDPTTRHIGAFSNDRNIGCATFLISTYESQPAWRLRGMATAPDFRRAGLGRAMLALAEQTLRAESDIPLLWCDARTPAVPFYQKQGWTIVSEEYVVPTAGPHYRMTRRLG
jgi:GNAT superfamily N-acetyltransferase